MSEENKKEQLDVFLTEIGDAIREVKSTTNLINARDMAGIVRGMSGGEDLTAELSEYDELNIELEDVIGSLPDAGSGGGGSGSIETCTVVYNYLDFNAGYEHVIYINEDGEPVMEPLTSMTPHTFTVQKNTLFYVTYGIGQARGNVTLIRDPMGGCCAALITDDVEFD